MTGEALTLSGELDTMLRAQIDPRTVPVRFSTLKAAGQSGAHYLHSAQDQFEQTLAMRLGSGVHALLLGKPVVMFAGKVRNGKQWEAFRDANTDAVILNSREFASAQAVALAVARHHLAEPLLAANKTREETITWEWMGRRCRSTPDARGILSIVELKTTKCAEPGRFARDAMWRSYHGQLAFYRLAAEAAGHGRARHVHVIAVESLAPYAVTVLQLTDRALEQGEKLCRLWMERLLGFEASNAYPGYLETVGEFDVPDDDEVGLVFGDGNEESENES